MHRHHRHALAALAAAAVADLAFGAGFAAADHVSVPLGLWFATETATTVGYGDVVPAGWLPHVLAVATMAVVIPLFAAAFSLLTSGLAAKDARAHVDRRLAEHHRAIHERLDRIEGRAAQPADDEGEAR